jgi:WD40 repeat protein
MVKVVKGISDGWGKCSHATQLGGFTRTLSYHNNSIAAGSELGDIIILNAITGSQSAVLSGHTGPATCVVFLPDGTSLVSGGYDKTVKLWDVQTGGVDKTFFGHTSMVWSVSISVDCTTIASGSHDKTTCLWNIQTGECYHTIQQQGYVPHVRFSPRDPQHLISISGNKVWQWDANGCQIRPPFDGSHIAFSSDGSQFVSCHGQTITVHNSSSGTTVTEFQAVNDRYLCCFSPDNRLVAVAMGGTAYCWDITTPKPQLVETFIGHTKEITSLVFSSCTALISASYDGSVRFWQIGAQQTVPAATNLKSTSPPLALIKSITLQSKEGVAFACDSDGVISVWDILIGTCITSHQTPAKHHQKRDVRFANGRLIFAWYEDDRIHVQDAENRELSWGVDRPWGGFQDLRISGDGSRVFGLDAPSILAWSLQTGEAVGKMEIEYEEGGGSLIVDGSKVWACWPESNYKGWDFSIPGSTPMELPGISTPPGPSRLWELKQARIMNPVTGEVVFQLSGRFASPVCVQCDNTCLVAGYQSGEILILDLTNAK